jgi:hypothetical protein
MIKSLPFMAVGLLLSLSSWGQTTYTLDNNGGTATNPGASGGPAAIDASFEIEEPTSGSSYEIVMDGTTQSTAVVPGTDQYAGLAGNPSGTTESKVRVYLSSNDNFDLVKLSIGTCQGGDQTFKITGSDGATVTTNAIPVVTVVEVNTNFSNITYFDIEDPAGGNLGCFWINTITLDKIGEVPCLLEVAITDQTDVLCKGDNNGTITATVTGNAGLIDYVWSNGTNNFGSSNTTETGFDFEAGPASVTVTDVNSGCQASDEVILSEPTALQLDIEVVQHAANGNDGELLATVTGGVMPYSYTWDNGSDSARAVMLEPIVHNLTVLDSNGCEISGYGEIFEPAGALSFQAIDDHVVIPHSESFIMDKVTLETWVYWGNSGSVVEFISGKDVEELEIHTGGGAGSNSVRFIPTTGVYIDAQSGSFLPGLWNHLVCQYDPENEFAAIYVNGIMVPVTKNGGSPMTQPLKNTATAFVLGRRINNSYPFNGKMDEFRIWNRILSSTEINDHMNCQLTGEECGLIAYYNFNAPGAFSNAENAGISTLVDGSGNGNDGTLSGFNLSGGASNWVEQASNVSGSCTLPEALEVSILVEEEVSCHGAFDATISASVQGGVMDYAYDWAIGATTKTLAGLGAATYSLEVTDAYGCMDSAGVVLGQPDDIELDATTQKEMLGNDGSIDLSITGGFGVIDYDWDNDGLGEGGDPQDLENLAGGEYKVIVTDEMNCMDSLMVTVETLITSTSEETQANITTYPSETSDYFSVMNSENSVFDMVIVNQTGAEVYSTSVAVGENKFSISDLGSGYYTVILSNNEQRITSHLIVR